MNHVLGDGHGPESRAGAASAVVETDEANNCKASGTAVTVTP